MNLRSLITRAMRGFREERRLYLSAIFSLAIAFLCLASAILALRNFETLSSKWSEAGKISVYLDEGLSKDARAELELLLSGLREIREIESVSNEEARLEFLASAAESAALSELPAELFPASLELYLIPDLGAAEIDALAARLGSLSGVASIERYQSFFERLDRMIDAGRWGAIGLSLLVALLVFGVVGSTIRLSLARRSREIEVMRLVGAQPGFIRGPLIVEGIFQGVAAALIALLALGVFYYGFRAELDLGVRLFFGGETVFFGPAAIVGFIFGGALMGGLGSTLSLRRYLA